MQKMQEISCVAQSSAVTKIFSAEVEVSPLLRKIEVGGIRDVNKFWVVLVIYNLLWS